MPEYPITCWNCMGEFDALAAVWCSCNPNKPTKVCPFCLQCFCAAPEEYHLRFWEKAPANLVKDQEMLVKARGPLGEALIRAKAITSEQLLAALRRQETTGERLGQILVDLGFVTQDTLSAFLSSQRSVMQISLKEIQPDPMLVASVGSQACIEHAMVPVGREKLGTRDILTLAMADPSDGEGIDFVQRVTGCQILTVKALREEILEFLEPFAAAPPSEDPSGAAAGESPDSRLAVELLRKAMARGASDLYVEPLEDRIAIHLRIDGILYQAKSIQRDYQQKVTDELKGLLRLNSAVTDRPQEGRVVMRSGNQRFDVIAHCLPTRNGENISVKIINRDTFFKTYDHLGLSDEEQSVLREALASQRGLVLVTAPLFHGSTTTLYAVMKEVAEDGRRKVMSIEAQSVCPVPGVTQVSLGEGQDAEATGTTIKALSNIHPDVCVIADLVDSQTMAAQMHKLSSQLLVVAAFEAQGTVAAVQHLIGVGFPREDLSQGLLLALNQRLVRRVCPECSVPDPVSETLRARMDLEPDEIPFLAEARKGEGCPACSGIGYRGRIALYELLSPSAAFRKALARGVPEKQLQKEAAKGSLVTLRKKALGAIAGGQTTVEEFLKEHL